MTTTIHEAAREIPVLEEVDVLVAGGGVSGCAAALAAARAGAKTILVERNGCLGGVATATLMANIGNRYLTASGEQVVHGIAGEVVQRLIQAGAASSGWADRKVPGIVMDSERLKVVLIEMLDEAGVITLTHAMAVRPVTDGDAVRGCFLESKSGRQAILAANTVDATGELDLTVQTKAEVVQHRGNSSLLFKITGVDLNTFVEFLRRDPEGFPAGMDWVRDVETLAENWYERGIFFFPHYGGHRWRFLQDAVAKGRFQPKIPPAVNLDVMGMYGLRGCGSVVINSNYYTIEGLNVRDLSRFELHAQKMCYYVGQFLRDNVPGFAGSRVEHVGADLGIRGVRYIQGRALLREKDMRMAPGPTHCDDVIGTAIVEGDGKAGQFFTGFTCDVPFGITVPRGVSNLLVGSGKSVSSEGGNKRLIRGMSGCMMIGQATGVAAALGARRRTPAADVPIREIQKELIRQGARLGTPSRLQSLGLA